MTLPVPKSNPSRSSLEASSSSGPRSPAQVASSQVASSQVASSQVAGASDNAGPAPGSGQPQLRVLYPTSPTEAQATSSDQPRGPVEVPPITREIPNASPELLEELAAESQRLETATPQEILRWAVDRFAPKFTMATAFGPEGMTIIHMLATIAPETPVFNLDTGYQFAETLELREEVKRRYGIEVEFKKPRQTVQEFEAENGGPVYQSDPNRCCFERKIRVLHDAAEGFQAWASAIRRDQSSARAAAPIVGWDKKFGLVKVSPLANWTKKQVWALITQEDIPYNPLHDQGYTSIGCWPCTRSVLPGEDERAGRWSGFAKTECGLHTSD